MQINDLQGKLTEYLFASSKLTADFIIAKTILDNIEKFPDFYLKEIAIEAQVAESTVTKFCNKLGYDGFKELRNDVAKYKDSQYIDTILNDISMSNSQEELIPLLASLETNIMTQASRFFNDNQLEEIAEILKTTKHGLLLAPIYLFETIQTFQEFLARKGHRFYHLLRSSDQQIINECAKNSQVVFIFSLGGEWIENNHATLSMLKEKGLKIIAFTCVEHLRSPYIDVAFYIGDASLVGYQSAYIQYIFFKYLCLSLISKM